MNNLKAARKAKRLTQVEVAKYIGITQSAYSWWETGRANIDSTSLAKLATLFEVSTDYLLGKNNVFVKFVRIPVYGDVAAGIPMEAIENIIDYEEISAELASTGEFFGLRIKGNSMEPKISEGDVVIVRKQDNADTGDIVIVMVNGDSATCKRLKKDFSGIFLISNNTAYDPMFYSNEDIENKPVRIIGKVVELRAKF